MCGGSSAGARKPATAHSPAPKNHPKTIPSKENYDLAVPKAAPAPVPVVETPGGDVLNLVIGFEPTNIKALGTSDFETYVVNDSNYFVMMSVATRGRNDRTWAPRWHGVVEPNMQDFAWELAQSDLPAFDRHARAGCRLQERPRIRSHDSGER